MRKFLLFVGLSAILSWNGQAEPRAQAFYSSYEEIPLEAGIPVLLVFFSTGCSTCWDDLFEMRYFIENNRLNAVIVGVTSDRRTEVEAFVRKYGWSLPVVLDRKRNLFRLHKISLLPCKVLLLDGRTVLQDDYYLDFWARREEMKRRLLDLGSRREQQSNRSRMSEFLPPGRRVLYIPGGPGDFSCIPGRN